MATTGAGKPRPVARARLWLRVDAWGRLTPEFSCVGAGLEASRSRDDARPRQLQRHVGLLLEQPCSGISELRRHSDAMTLPEHVCDS
jgi:hypothetical protein